MDAKHTPEPWQVCGHANSGHLMVETAGPDNPQLVADCQGDDRISAAECRANARLIAAAPDLLAALRDTLSAWVHEAIQGDGIDEKHIPIRDAALAAIFKATGN